MSPTRTSTAADRRPPREVSRAALAVNATLWRATGAMYLVFASAIVAIIVLGTPSHGVGDWPFAAWLLIAAAAHLAAAPPRIDAPTTHLPLVCASGSVTAAFVLVHPSALAVGGAMFVAPLISVRLQDPRMIVLHTAAASAAFLAVAAAGLFGGVVDDATALAAGLVAIATPVQVVSCTAVLRAAEAQARELEAAIRTDPLTGAGNRRAFDEGLAAAFARARAEHRPLGLLVVDVDDFASIQRADPVVARTILQRVAQVIGDAVPESSSVCRLDGDEFATILPADDARDARQIARRIEATFGAAAGPDGLPDVAVHAVAATVPGDALTPGALIEVADQRLRGHRLRDHRRDPDGVGRATDTT